MSEERYEAIAHKADDQISKTAGDDKASYIEGLEIAVGILQCNIDAAKEEMEEDGE